MRQIKIETNKIQQLSKQSQKSVVAAAEISICFCVLAIPAWGSGGEIPLPKLPASPEPTDHIPGGPITELGQDK